MFRRIKYLIMFITFSILLGYPTYLLVAEGEPWSAAYMFGAWIISSLMLYAVYVGWLQTGASVVRAHQCTECDGTFCPSGGID